MYVNSTRLKKCKIKKKCAEKSGKSGQKKDNFHIIFTKHLVYFSAEAIMDVEIEIFS